MSLPTNFNGFNKNFCDLEELRKHWVWFFILGLIFILIGTTAIGASIVTTVVSVVVIGSLLFFCGSLQVIYAFWTRQWSGFFLSILSGIIYTIAGLFLVLHPAAGALTLTLLLAAFYTVGGLFRMVGSISLRFERWGWAFFSGAIKFVLGLLIWSGWPETGLWVIGLFVGIDLLFYGWFWVLLALTARNQTSVSTKP